MVNNLLLNYFIKKDMTKKFYRKEYSFNGWVALVDGASEMGCDIAYSKYGTYITIDSTKVEDKLMIGNNYSRQAWAETIYDNIQCLADEARCTI